MSLVKLDLGGLDVPQLINLTERIVAAMTGNPNFATPLPALADVTAAKNGLSAAYTQAQNLKSQTAVAFQAASAKTGEMAEKLSLLASYVENVSQGEEAIILSAEMKVRNPRSAPVVPETPTILKAEVGAESGRWICAGRGRGAQRCI